ncbi:hypothetical protein HOLleu_01893 [Holothuria leucospilota]|uniref:Uncharacterized protein n=1 Tax=Holothuria leucospilota TaxID=206669 RepID=A0A9Q1CQW4_HOLLE|nr:hypothetical protein HOLleu_01893 [Holothuria leucospilota]
MQKIDFENRTGGQEREEVAWRIARVNKREEKVCENYEGEKASDAARGLAEKYTERKRDRSSLVESKIW